MKVIVGLGNPGDQYARTKHNVGFWVIDQLSQRWGIACRKDKFKALVGDGLVHGEKVLLCKPTTFMNLSGEAIASIKSFYREISTTDVIVVYDDMDFAPGQLKLREKGSAGGHNGVKSVIQHMGTDVFPRVRVGIGRPTAEQTVIQHVLSPFSRDVLPNVEAAVAAAADALDFALQNDFAAAMNRFNVRS